MIPMLASGAFALLGKSKVKVAIAATIVVVLSAGWVHYSSLRSSLNVARAELRLLEGQLTLKSEHVEKLKAVVQRQNEQVAVLEELSAIREDKILETESRLQETRDALLQDIAQLRMEIGTTCSDGIALINRELGL
jgi:chromosome segregation ATPase